MHPEIRSVGPTLTSAPLGPARVDLEDKEAVRRVLDGPA
jgi:hypothetical protein